MHVIATAGHVDHGKSTLVRALTGMEPDRWEAERRRGMTIDLGYAWTEVPGGEQIAFVDVPGHERFVANMLAGAGPAPAVMFVVAADGGWMPQSAEHLAAIDAFGVRHGVLVITRSDLADPQRALRQAAKQIAGTSLGGVIWPTADPASQAPHEGTGIEAVTVSAATGQGIPELLAALGRLAARLPSPDPGSAIRLWLDRVFAMKGSGTVVTGTLQAGTVRLGDELLLTPAMRTVRVRGVQSLGASVSQARGVARVALNLRGISTRDLGRGAALLHAGRWTLTSQADVRLSHRAAADRQPDIELPGQVTLHIGTARTVARVRMLGRDVARLQFGRPLPLHVGDRILLRDPGAAPGRAQGQPIFGGTVLDVSPPTLRGTGAAAAAARELASWPEPPAAADLLRRHRLLRASTAAAMGVRELPPPVAGEWLAEPRHWRRLGELLADAVAAHAERDPLAPGLQVDAARAELGLPDRALIEALVTGGAGRIELSGGYLRRAVPAPGQERSARLLAAGLPAPVTRAVQALLADLDESPFGAPDAARLAELRLDTRAAAAAERAGLLRRLPGNVILPADARDRAVQILTGLPQPFTAAQARQALRTSRRVVIPLLEWLDRSGVTRRLPDDRRVLRDQVPD